MPSSIFHVLYPFTDSVLLGSGLVTSVFFKSALDKHPLAITRIINSPRVKTVYNMLGFSPVT
jgi:hypothetical protein